MPEVAGPWIPAVLLTMAAYWKVASSSTGDKVMVLFWLQSTVTLGDGSGILETEVRWKVTQYWDT